MSLPDNEMEVKVATQFLMKDNNDFRWRRM